MHPCRLVTFAIAGIVVLAACSSGSDDPEMPTPPAVSPVGVWQGNLVYDGAGGTRPFTAVVTADGRFNAAISSATGTTNGRFQAGTGTVVGTYTGLAYVTGTNHVLVMFGTQPATSSTPALAYYFIGNK